MSEEILFCYFCWRLGHRQVLEGVNFPCPYSLLHNKLDLPGGVEEREKQQT